MAADRPAGPEPINLRSTAHFTILAGASITTTGGGIINGDIGASPIAGSAILLTQAQVNGAIYAVDASGRVLRDNVWGPQEEDATRRDFTINAMY